MSTTYVVDAGWDELLSHRHSPATGPSTDPKPRVGNVAHLQDEVAATVTHLPRALDGAWQYEHLMHNLGRQIHVA